jgi:CheY-like chemotaxis protein
MRILIVEDNAIALQVLHNALVQAGHEVQTARGGQEALEIVRSGDCSLVVSDWEMPGMSGVELFRAIRAEELPT